LEFYAGNFDEYYIFLRNNFYFNSGICLVNKRKFREDNLYKRAFFAAIAYDHLPCPYQDIFLMISNYKFKYWPLNYNAPQFFQTDKEKEEKNYNTSTFRQYLDSQKNTIFRYSKEELVNAALNPVIVHLYSNKPFLNLANEKFTKMWIEYSKLANVYSEIKIKYPTIFNDSKIKR
jgi:lipopolysaccharide biosynthesis glycosyltransferase